MPVLTTLPSPPRSRQAPNPSRFGYLIVLNYSDCDPERRRDVVGDRRLRILYTAVDTPVPGTHGGSVHVVELCRALAQRGHDVHIVSPRLETGGADASEIGWPVVGGDGGMSVQIIRISRRRRFLEWTAVREIRRIAERVQPDVLLERFYTFGGAGIWAAHGLGLPAVLEVNSPARRYPGSWRDRIDRLSVVGPVHRWRRRQLAWSDAIYATSKRLLPPDLQESVTVVTNGVDITRFRRAPAGREPGSPLECVYASSFRSWHGAIDLVKAVAQCVSRGVDLRVTCLGTGPLWRDAQEAAQSAGVLDVMRFVGRVPYEEVPAHLARADVGLAPFDPGAFPALQLGWFWSPIKIFEYLASGLAVVTIGIPELRELLPGAVARFYTPGDVEGLADAMEALAADRSALDQIQLASRSLAESRYTWGHQAAAVENVLRTVVP